MLLFSWLHKRLTGQSQTKRTPQHKSTVRFRPRLDALEDRCLPSTYTVTSPIDAYPYGPGTLRGEIAVANSGDTIVFSPFLDGRTIFLFSELRIGNSLKIEGPGAGLLAISGHNCRVFDVEPFAGLGTQVTLSGLTIENGLSVGSISNGNDHRGAGAGIYNTATLTVSGCTIANNTAINSLSGQYGGAIFNKGILTVTGSTLSGNHSNFGGGINNQGTLTVSGCTFSGNSAASGGGLGMSYLGSTATLTNCTFSKNSAIGSSGAIAVPPHSAVTLTNCTLSLNLASIGGAISVSTGGILNLTNTIVAGNTATNGPDIYGFVTTADHNLVGNATDSSGIVNGVNGNIAGGNGNPVINALLGPLQNNGGPTQTMALLAGSPAIGRANSSKAPATDQRGFVRLDESGELTDIGAFEL